MKEYSLMVIFALLVCLVLDLVLLKTNLIKNKRFWWFMALVAILQTIVDNWLNGRYWNDGYLVGPYDQQFYSGIKIWETPLENYFFGIGLLWMNLIFLEFFKAKRSKNLLNPDN